MSIGFVKFYVFDKEEPPLPSKTHKDGAFGAGSLSKNGKNSVNGKEESYERNPGRVPFVFNQKFSELF